MNPNHSLTVLTTASRRLYATKRWQADGTCVPYDRAKTFIWREVAPGDLRQFFSLLQGLTGDPYSCLVRARVREDRRDEKRIRRTIRASADGTPPYLEADGASIWATLDLDGALYNGTLRDAPTAARAMLPEPFRSAACVFQHSASAGMRDGKLSGHLVFQLSRPLDHTTAEHWVRTIPGLDPATLRPAQPYYTATPLFDGIPDPVTHQGCKRIVWLDGNETVEVPAHIPTPEQARQTREQDARERMELATQREARRVAALAQARETGAVTSRADWQHIDLVGFAGAMGWEPRARREGTIWDIRCPNEHSHSTRSGRSATSILQAEDGRQYIRCQHAGCAHLGQWTDAPRQPYLRTLAPEVWDAHCPQTEVPNYSSTGLAETPAPFSFDGPAESAPGVDETKSLQYNTRVGGVYVNFSPPSTLDPRGEAFRAKIATAMRASESDVRRLAAFGFCAVGRYVGRAVIRPGWLTETGDFIRRGSSCHDLLCPACTRVVAREIWVGLVRAARKLDASSIAIRRTTFTGDSLADVLLAMREGRAALTRSACRAKLHYATLPDFGSLAQTDDGRMSVDMLTAVVGDEWPDGESLSLRAGIEAIFAAHQVPDWVTDADSQAILRECWRSARRWSPAKRLAALMAADEEEPSAGVLVPAVLVDGCVVAQVSDDPAPLPSEIAGAQYARATLGPIVDRRERRSIEQRDEVEARAVLEPAEAEWVGGDHTDRQAQTDFYRAARRMERVQKNAQYREEERAERRGPPEPVVLVQTATTTEVWDDDDWASAEGHLLWMRLTRIASQGPGVSAPLSRDVSSWLAERKRERLERRRARRTHRGNCVDPESIVPYDQAERNIV